jgi:hypothetical protein
MGRLIAKVRKSLRRTGIIGTVRRAGERLYGMVRDQTPARRRERRLRAEQDRDFDRRFHVDTAGFIPLDRLAIGSTNRDFGFAYDPIQPERFQRTAGSLALRHEDYIFIDFGSGKGKSVLLASELPFKKIIGVEFSPDLYQIAQRNIQTYQNPNQKCKDIELVCMDAAEFPIPPVPAVLFMFNPFGKEVMERVIENVRRSYEAHPRELYVAYATPVLEDMWAKVEFLAKITDEGAYFTAYRTKPPV